MEVQVLNDKDIDVISMAFQSGGEVLNGATDLNDNGTYYAPNPGMSLYGDTFILHESWFNGNPQSIDIVIDVVLNAVGLNLNFTSGKISGYTIHDNHLYSKTIEKTISYNKNMHDECE